MSFFYLLRHGFTWLVLMLALLFYGLGLALWDIESRYGLEEAQEKVCEWRWRKVSGLWFA